MTRRDYITRILTLLEVGKPLKEDEAIALAEYIADLEGLADNGDMDDYHGTEGWRHHLGMDNDV